MMRASRAVALLPLAVLGATIGSFASCAANEPDPRIEDDASFPIPEAGALDAPDAPDAAVDAACDASDLGCTREVLPCERAALCMVENPVDAAHALTSVWGSGRDDVWAVGSAGTIVHWDGSVWTKLATKTPNTFTAIWGSGPSDIWIGSTTSLVLHVSGVVDGGVVAENLGPSVSSTSPSYAGGRPITALWGSSSSDLRIGTRSFIAGIDTEDYTFEYYGRINRYLMTTTDEGEALWRLLPGKEHIVKSIWGSSRDDVWMAVDNSAFVAHERGVLLHGVPYQGPPPNPNTVSRGDYCSDCEPGCTLCAMVDDPLLWSRVDSQSSVPFEALWGSSAADVWAVGERGTIRRLRSGEDRWQRVESQSTVTLRAVWGSGPDDVWFAGDEGTVLHYDGAKVLPAVVQLPLGPKPNLRGIWGSAANDVWIVGDVVTLHYTGPKPGVTRGGE